jgi:hypothetical protein
MFPDCFNGSHDERDRHIEGDDPYGDEKPEKERDDPSTIRSVENKTCYPPSTTSFS